MEHFVAESVLATDSARKFQSFSLGHGHDTGPRALLEEFVRWFCGS